jgi:hypothetical protein
MDCIRVIVALSKGHVQIVQWLLLLLLLFLFLLL